MNAQAKSDRENSPRWVALCDAEGFVAMCDECGQIHSPYWSAAKSAHMHRRGTGHTVTLIRLGK
jgi:hypothetical protein